MATCALCGDCWNSKPDWCQDICPDCKANHKPSLEDRVSRMETEIKDIKRR